MMRIQNADEVEEAFFSARNFGQSIDKVRSMLEDVRARGDDALRQYASQFDVCSPAQLRVPQQDLEAAVQTLKAGNPALYDALCYSRDLALRFARRQRECFPDFEQELEPGLFAGQKNIPVSRAGVYVPAGRFALVSTVVMTVTPAVAAGVGKIVLCTPPRVHPDDREQYERRRAAGDTSALTGCRPYADQNILAAASLCGVTDVFAVGGAQAVGAMAFGTASIPSVDVIVGPGNKYVAEAKRLVFGTTGIDMIAGPTEVFIIADDSADPAWLAADLLAQAEHDVVAQPVLATPSASLAQAVARQVEVQLGTLSTAQTAAQSIQNCGRIIVTKSLEQAAQFANRKAPEHLEIAMDAGAERDKVVSLVHNYGSLFIGHDAAEVLGDYAAGLNHTLPTSACARFTGGLSVRAFIKTVTTLRTQHDSQGLLRSAGAAAVLGDAEGLSGHARAARLRLNGTLEN